LPLIEYELASRGGTAETREHGTSIAPIKISRSVISFGSFGLHDGQTKQTEKFIIVVVVVVFVLLSTLEMRKSVC